MKPYQERMTAEAADISAKCENLSAFINTNVYFELPQAEQWLMLRQLGAMLVYASALQERLVLVNISESKAGVCPVCDGAEQFCKVCGE